MSGKSSKRRGSRGKGRGRNRKQQTPLSTEQRSPELEGGIAVPQDIIPSNSALLGEDDEDVMLDEFGNPLPAALQAQHKHGEAKPNPAEQAQEQGQGQEQEQPQTTEPAAPGGAPPEAFAHFPAPKLDEEPEDTVETLDAGYTAFDPPKVRDKDRDTQRRLSWIADKIEIGSCRDQTFGLTPEVKIRAALALVEYSSVASDPQQPGVKEPIMQVHYMTAGIWITIPWSALPMEFRRDPSKLSIERAASILTGFFRTFPCEMIRPKPKPRELERIPQFMREAIARGATANARAAEEK